GPARWRLRASALLAVAAWIALGQYTYSTEWKTRSDRRVADNPHWLIVSSWWQAGDNGIVRMSDEFPASDLRGFSPIVARTVAARSAVRRASVAALPGTRRSAAARPLNVVIIVLESVGARWASLNPGLYPDTTPALKAEAQRGIVFDNFYAHIGRS